MTETATISVPDLVAVVRRSGLVDDLQLKDALQGVELQRVQAEDIAQLLIEAKLLTPWQSKQVLKGRYKGYRLGKYLLLGELGRGGMAKVFLARHETLRNHVAIKVLARHRLAKPSMIHRFLREARAAAQLSHPNIVRVFDVDADEDRHYLVMEYIRGRSVQDIVDDDGPLSCERAARVTYEAALGLAAAHKHGLIHRDVKPANLLVEDEKLVRLTDFGLARAAGEEEADAASLTMQHDEKVLGTADYIAPEQAINSHAIDARADLYSLGYTLYFMLTGQPPFPTGRIVERLTKHCTQEPESISTFRSDVPESLLAIVNKMTRKRADERYSSADAVAEALSDWLAQPDAPSHGASVAAKWVRQSAAPARPSSAVLSGSSIDDDELDLAPEDEKGVTAAASKPAATLTTAKTDRPLLPELSSKALVDDVQLQPLMGGLDELLDELPQALPCFAGSSSDVHGSDAQTHEIEQSRVDTAAGSTLPSRVDLQQKRDSSALGRFYGEMKRGEYPLWLLIGAGLIMGAVAMLVVWSYASSNEQVDLPAYKRLEP